MFDAPLCSISSTAATKHASAKLIRMATTTESSSSYLYMIGCG